MRTVFLLLKKDFLESRITKKSRGRDIFGTFTTLLLFSIIYAVFVYVFYHFANTYIGTIFGEFESMKDRAYELMIGVMAVAFISCSLVGVKKIYEAIVNSQDVDVLLSQPISATELFTYKLVKVYKSILLTCSLILIPTTIVVDILTTTLVGGFVFYVELLVLCFFIPVVGCAIASLIAIPFNFIMRFIENRFILHLIIYVVIIGIGFYFYSLFLNLLNDLLRTGGLKYVFELSTINIISDICSKAYPINYFGNMLFGIHPGKNFIIIMAIVLLAAVISYFIIHRLYVSIMQKKMEGNSKIYISKLKNRNAHKPISALLIKEYLVILRTPAYAFQYFATTFSLPLMVYVCVGLLRSMMNKLPSIYMIDSDYEIALFVISMFAVLTNTFCTSNISRDGNMIGILKTLPIKGKTIVLTKILFCAVIGVVSVLTSCILLLIVGFINWWQSIIIFILATLLSLAEIAYATRKDLNKPSSIGEMEYGGGGIASGLIFIALSISLILGGGVIALSTILTLQYNANIALFTSILFAFILVVVVSILAGVYLFKGLDESFKNSNGGEL